MQRAYIYYISLGMQRIVYAMITNATFIAFFGGDCSALKAKSPYTR